ncbi:methyltransferase family protein [Pseudomonas tohonis]|uniref:methyltransferase family protein n=1 Tax=Pseudomonas tohonis TaxID=2725477 RepID=UPI0021D9874A|nr:isoprenylcysteine carboxylmethyltransferase family protein [Pseudomonas tohonis]UXY50626.1 isoprenylcysteine carboxylmethyltransferase family protein [Pseudomonas tohonis]
MDRLEKRIPPVLATLICALLMALLAYLLPPVEIAWAWRLGAALALAALGAGVCLAGVASFRRARTTVNPLVPEQASSLVQAGIYRHTRNPMYLGFAILLVAWAALLGAPLALFVVTGFVLYVDRFQIAPEERALAGLFGADYTRYRERVRRWL